MVEEAEVEESKKAKYPINMIYCKCGLPPEYCEFGGKTNDTEDCKKWLAEQHPELHDKLYPPVEADEETKEGEEVKKKKKK